MRLSYSRPPLAPASIPANILSRTSGSSLGKSTKITGVGGRFGGYPGGTIFGAIVPLASQTSLPSFAPIVSNAVADVVFSLPTVTAVDYSAPLSVELPAGSHAVIFGSGPFGADGWGGLGDQNTPVGSPNYVSYFSFSGNAWGAESYDGIRITVSGVPEASDLGDAARRLCGARRRSSERAADNDCLRAYPSLSTLTPVPRRVRWAGVDALSLHDSDFSAWRLEQAVLLRAGRASEADLATISEEIESMGKTEKRELINRLTVLLLHLLGRQYHSIVRWKSWRPSIANARRDR